MSPYNSWYKEEAIEVCVAVWVLFQYPLFQRWEHRVHHCTLSGKGWFMKPTSSGRYTILITIITKGNNQLCLWAGAKELSWGVEKQVYTLLIWTLLLVLSLSSLSRTSKPGNGMNSILRTCKFINCCVYSRI